jgi:hypothetical protein
MALALTGFRARSLQRYDLYSAILNLQMTALGLIGLTELDQAVSAVLPIRVKEATV